MRVKAFLSRSLMILPLWLVGATLAAQAEAPRADAVLQAMSSYLTSLESFHFRAKVDFDDVPASGVKLQYSGTLDVFVRRPDRLFLDYLDDLSARRIWFDGETFTLLDPIENLWAEVEGEATLGATLDRLAADHGHSVPLDDLLVDDPYSRLMSGVKAHRNLGLSKVAGVDCHHLVFGREDLTWQIWVDAGDRPLPRKVVITYSDLPMAPQYEAELTGWDLEPGLQDNRFQPVIPAGAVQIDPVSLEEKQP